MNEIIATIMPVVIKLLYDEYVRRENLKNEKKEVQ
jgi:hypothetical protein